MGLGRSGQALPRQSFHASKGFVGFKFFADLFGGIIIEGQEISRHDAMLFCPRHSRLFGNARNTSFIGTAHLGGLLKFHHVAFGVHADLALKGAKVVGVIEF